MKIYQYLLSYSSSGYGLFYAEGLDVNCQNTEAVRDCVTDLNRFCKMVELVDFQPFDSPLEAIDEVLTISEGVMTDKLRTFLELNFQVSKANEFVLGVRDSNLGASISKETKISCRSNEFVLELLRGVRLHFDKFIRVFKPGEFEKPQLGSSIRAHADSNANMVIQAIYTLDTLHKNINSFSTRLRKCYGGHFPELVKIINDNFLYVKVSKFIGNKSDLFEDKLPVLTEIVGDEYKAKEIFKAAKASMGQDLNPLDLIIVQILAQRVMDLFEYRMNLYDYLVTKMNEIAPNLTCLVGEMLGASLISHAGSLTNLAKCPSSTHRILGAEKALFRALETQGNPPKHGLIFEPSVIGRASSENKGRMARYLANKCSIASRIDCFSEKGSRDFGEKLREQVDQRLYFYEVGGALFNNIDVMEPQIEMKPQIDDKPEFYAKRTQYKPTEVLDIAEAATVRIEVENENCGSGLILLKEGGYSMILTCFHVIKRAMKKPRNKIKILFSNLHKSEKGEFKPVSLLDHEKELGLLFGYDECMINMNLKSICSFAEIEDASQEVFCCSFPYGVEYAMRVAGRLSQGLLDNYIAYDLGVAIGSSGAAILNDRAEILAVHIQGEKAPVFKKEGEEEKKEGEEEEEAPVKIGYTGGVVKYGMTAYEIAMELKHLTDSLRRPDLYHRSISATIVNLFMFYREEERARREEMELTRKRKRKEKRAGRKKRREEEESST